MAAGVKSEGLRWHPVEGAAGWLIPGLGHWLLGERGRGVVLMASLYGLFGAGLLIGGLGVVDHGNPLAFTGQVMAGPVAVAADVAHTWLGNPGPAVGGGEEPALTPGLNRTAEIGSLYCAIAGLLNLLAIVDVVARPGGKGGTGGGG